MPKRLQKAIQITLRGIDASEAIERAVLESVAEMDCHDVHLCRVLIDAPRQSNRAVALYLVRIELHLRGDRPVSTRQRRYHHAHENLFVAIRDAFDYAKLTLADHWWSLSESHETSVRTARAEVVGLFPRDGYGFAELANGTHVYFHETSVVGSAFSSIQIGDRVGLVLAEDERGDSPHASAVLLIGKSRDFS